MPNGCLIAFEGTEGAGKTSQLQLAAEVLRRDGYRVLVTAEPGGTALGLEIRRLLLHRSDSAPTPLAELFLYLADRAQHVAEVIKPALSAGDVVLADRFTGSTIAYQGFGRNLDVEMIARVENWARSGVAPRLTVLLDCPVRVGLERARGCDRFHTETEAFHERVRQGFLRLAAERGWCVVDATQPEDEVHRHVMDAIRASLAGL